jgi:hypothetical protein
MPSRLSVALKALSQLGPAPLALNLLYKLGVRSGHYRRLEDRLLRNIRARDLPPLFSLPPREHIEQVLGDAGKERLLAEADEIAAGKFCLFGGDPFPLILAFDGPLQHWTHYELHPERIISPHAPVTDIKFLWEPARFGWAYALGRAYHLTRDDKYPAAFWGHFERFISGNPPYLGPHWMNGQEVAIRLMALVWAARVFEDAPSTTPGRRAALSLSVAQHAARIPHTLVYARSQNNNHLVTESAGLYTAGLALQDRAWRDLGWRWLNWCLQHQVSGYGEYIQHSTNYHRLVLQAALWVNLVKTDLWPHTGMQSLERLTHFLFSMLDGASGRVPNLGANDGALILPLSTLPYEDFRPTVQAAARAFLHTQVPSGPWDEAALWLGLPPASKTYEPEHYLGENLHGADSWAYLRASRFKSRLGHMDQLHLDLWWRGLNIAQDAGTYFYIAPPPWDNPLVSTRVHNTVMVDDRDQMLRAGRFLSLDWFPAWSQTVFESDPQILQKVVAWHRGYKGVLHERAVTVCTGDRWVVEDRLVSSASHRYRLHWLLPDWQWELEDHAHGLELSLKSPGGWIRMLLSAAPGAVLQPSLVRAGELLHGQRRTRPYEGWVSPIYGVRVPALSLALETGPVKTMTLTTEFTFPA